jgi:hypothetical protein
MVCGCEVQCGLPETAAESAALSRPLLPTCQLSQQRGELGGRGRGIRAARGGAQHAQQGLRLKSHAGSQGRGRRHTGAGLRGGPRGMAATQLI